MNESHIITGVSKLHEDSKALYQNVVLGKADNIIKNLGDGLTTLEKNWEGKDAGTQIQNVVGVYNAMVAVRNVLGDFAMDSTKIAKGYREIQNANRAGLEDLDVINNDHKEKMADYSDTRDTVNITPEADNGRQKIEMAANDIDVFVNEAKKYLDIIMENWKSGPGREKAQEAFNEFFAKSKDYKQILKDTSESVKTSIRNYNETFRTLQ